MAELEVASALTVYHDRTAGSREAHRAAEKWIPGGVSRQTLAYPPYPFYARDAHGSTVVDVDGNEYVDLVNNYTSLIHGHAFEPVLEAAEQSLRIASVGTPHVLEAAFAELLCERLPALERVHFATTGSEAVVYALRLARAATGRNRILAFEGGFHGSANETVRGMGPSPMAPGEAKGAEAASLGLEPTTAVTAVYNDRVSVDAAFRRWGSEIAGVILEPFLGNSSLIDLEPDFYEYVVRTAHHHGALVILDEVQALRIGYNGWHGSRNATTPDLVATGKVMGGGFPLAAFGGSAELLAILDGPTPPLVQTGTFTGMPTALAAGYTAMQYMDRDAYDRLDDLGERFRSGLRLELARAGLKGHVNGQGSMFNLSFNEQPVTTYRVHKMSDLRLLATLHHELLARGVLLMPRGTGCLSTPMGDTDVEHILGVFRESFEKARSL